MSLADTVDLLADFPGWCTTFEPLWRQEQSVQANGIVRGKDFGTPLWRGAWQSRQLEPNELDRWRARLDGLNGIILPFRGYPLSRAYPIAYPGGAWPGGGGFSGACTVASAGGQALALSGLPGGYQVSAGDMVGVTTADHAWLFRARQDAVAVAGVTPAFAVVPPIPAGLLAGQAATVTRAWCPMTLVPAGLAYAAGVDGVGSVSFTATEMR